MARTTGNPRDFKQSDGPPGFRVPTQWLVVSVCFLSTVCVGEVMWTFGVFFTSFEQEFGWSRGLISAGYTSLMFGNSISLIVGGRLADRDAARQTMLTCAVIGAAAIALCSQIHSPLQLCLLFFMSGLGAGAFMSTPNSIVQRWFEGRPHSGLALSIVMAGVGVGGIIFAPVFRHLITVYGWRPTFMVAGGLFLLMATHTTGRTPCRPVKRARRGPPKPARSAESCDPNSSC
jgi:AAHS family 4-hydroxybenzoate transporter-like MFS transporter